MRLGWLALLLVAATPARAAELADEGDAYCAFVGGVTRSESALLLSPQLFVDYGWVNGPDATTSGTTGITTLPATQRLTAGLRYSFVQGLGAGIVARQRAAAECERYRATAALARLIVDNREGVSPASLDAKLAVMRAANDRARQIVLSTRAAVERSRATVDELHAVELRLDELVASIAEAEALRAGLPDRSSLPTPDALFRQQLVATERVERYDARLRWLRGIDLSVRAGYDQVFGVRDQTPLFAIASLTINPAIFYQPFADADARRGRLRWTPIETEGVPQRAAWVASRLRTLYAGERRRLDQATLLLSDLEARLKAIEAVGGEKLMHVRDAMWFDWVNAKAEHEFLRVHVGELATLVGEARP